MPTCVGVRAIVADTDYIYMTSLYNFTTQIAKYAHALRAFQFSVILLFCYNLIA